MNRYLKKNYALFNKETRANRGLIDGVKRVAKNPTSQYLFFGIVVCLFGFLVCTVFSRDVKALIPKDVFEIIKMITGPGDLTDFATTFPKSSKTIFTANTSSIAPLRAEI